MLYEKPFPVDDARYFVSKAGTVQLRDYAGNAVTLLESDDAMGFYNAIPIRAVAPPPVRTGLKMDRSVSLPEDGSVRGTGPRCSCRTCTTGWNRTFAAAR